jgi:hypothetical protein
MKKSTKKFSVVVLTVLILIAGTVALIMSTQYSSKRPDECQHSIKEIDTAEASEFAPGYVKYKCSNCSEEKTERINATGALPQLYLDGDMQGIAKDNDVIVKVDYVDSGDSFTSYSKLKYQGHTSMLYDKKNYTMKLYSDDSLSEKQKVSLHGWKKSSKYCLKANYIDFSQSRNIVSANIWSDVVSTRKNLDNHIADLQNYGAIDGYPIMLFVNDEYQGVYTMNIPKDDDTYEIGDDEGEALFVINSPDSESAHFRAEMTEEDKKSIFDLEYSFDDNKEWPYESLNNLIRFVINNDGDDFRNGISDYLDVDSAIDYLITAYYLGLTDNFNKNVLLLTYDGQRWIVSLYDMDTAFGLAFDGTRIYDSDYLTPSVKGDGSLDSGTDNLLWDRIINNYSKEIKERSAELRASFLEKEAVISRYEAFIKQIPQSYYDKDLELWGDIPLHEENNIEQINSFFDARSTILDNFFDTL